MIDTASRMGPAISRCNFDLHTHSTGTYRKAEGNVAFLSGSAVGNHVCPVSMLPPVCSPLQPSTQLWLGVLRITKSIC